MLSFEGQDCGMRSQVSEIEYAAPAEARLYLPHSSRMIVSFHTNEILATDSKVENILGFCDSELHGSSILIFCGPLTDASIIRLAIDSAAAFKTSSSFCVLYTKDGLSRTVKITSSPFLNSSNILVACMLEFQDTEEEKCAYSSQNFPVKEESTQSAPKFLDRADLGFLSLPGQDGSGPAIFPRRRGGNGGPVQPVVITLEILKSLEGNPLSEAAQKLGVSATAFKHACRKLGIQRWSYKKGGGRPSKPCVINNAYVQKLYRKYAAEKRSASSPSSFSPAGAAPPADCCHHPVRQQLLPTQARRPQPETQGSSGIAAFVVERVPSESGASSPVDSECWETDGRGPGFLLPDAPVPPAAAVAASHCLPPVYAPFEPDDHDHEDGDPEQPAANPAPIAFDW